MTASPFDAVVARLFVAGCVAAPAEAAELVDAAPDAETLDAWVARRERGEPVAWITGTTTFCGHRLHVWPGVYVPRRQTEDLAHRAATLLPRDGRVLDLCTGVGAVAAHLVQAVPSATVVAADRDERAARCARRNGVTTLVADLADAVVERRRFDLLTAVAPYVPTSDIGFLPRDVQDYEPRGALDGGRDGLDLVRRVIATASRLLVDDGWLLIEVGGEQDRALTSDLTNAGFAPPTSWTDDDGDLRGIAAQFAG